MDANVYSALVSGTDDFVGAIAYSLYKQTKFEWLEAIKVRNGGQDPTPAELDMFHETNMLPLQLQGYRDRAITLTNRFLKTATQGQVIELTIETQQSALALKFDETHHAVATALAALQKELASRRTWKDWCADVAAALIINA